MTAGSLAVLAVLLAAAGSMAASDGVAEPYRPERDDVVLEHVPAADDPAFREARRLAAALREHPEDRALALRAARRWIDLARAEGDMRLYGLAEGALAPWLDDGADGRAIPPAILLERATIRRARHDFAGARADLDTVLDREPGNLQALLDRAALSEALGAYDAALADCTQFARLRPGLIAEACMASALSLTGSSDEARTRLATALGATPNAPSSIRRWALTILGEIAARRGEVAAAERAFDAALALPGRDAYLLGAHADLMLDEARYGEVMELLDGEVRVDRLLLRRAIAAERAGDAAADPLVRELRARFAAVRRRGAPTHLREEARFVLHLEGDPSRAVELARTNWSRQRGPLDARILLEAALASGDADAAGPVLAWMERTGIEDVALERLAAKVEDRSS